MMGTAIARSTANGSPLYLMGAEPAELSRRNFTALIEAAPKRPQPKDAIRDFQRARPTSFEKFKALQAAALRASKPADAVRYIARELVLMSEHIVTPSEPEEAVVSDEEDFEHCANKEQRRLGEYVRTRNAEGLQQVIDTTARHEAALARLRYTATNALRSLTIAERSRDQRA